MLGTTAYMPLEQLDGKPDGARGDQFSFCVSLSEALYGERPFTGESLRQLFTAANVRHLRATGLLVMVLSVGVQLDFEQWTVAPSFHPTAAVAGMLFVFVSWVIDEGRRLEERRQRASRADP